MKTLLCITLATFMLNGCGIRKPLMPPKAIPAYEAKRERKRQKIEENQQVAPDVEDEEAEPKSDR